MMQIEPYILFDPLVNFREFDFNFQYLVTTFKCCREGAKQAIKYVFIHILVYYPYYISYICISHIEIISTQNQLPLLDSFPKTLAHYLNNDYILL